MDYNKEIVDYKLTYEDIRPVVGVMSNRTKSMLLAKIKSIFASVKSYIFDKRY